MGHSSWIVTHSGDGVERVLDRQQQDFVSANRILTVFRSADSPAGGEIEEHLLLSHMHNTGSPIRHAALCALKAVELHQSLILKRHHHDVAADNQQRETGVRFVSQLRR